MFILIVLCSAFSQCTTKTDPYTKTVSTVSKAVRFYYENEIAFGKFTSPPDSIHETTTDLYIVFFYHKKSGIHSIVVREGGEFNIMLKDSSIIKGYSTELTVGETKSTYMFNKNQYDTYINCSYSFKKEDLQKLLASELIGFRCYFADDIFDGKVKPKFKESVLNALKCIVD